MNQPLPPKDAPASICSHCSDTGRAWFYHEPEPTGNRKKRRVWVDKEAMALPEPAFAGVVASRLAICICDAGKRLAQSDMVRSNPEQFTTLRHVYKLAEERREWEGVEPDPEGQP